MPLINCKVEISLTWSENCILPTAGNVATFVITDAKLSVPIVTLSITDNARLSKLLRERFKRPIYWNKYKVIPNKIVEIAAKHKEHHITELLDSSCRGVKRLFVLAYDNTADDANHKNQVSIHSFKKYFLPRVKIESYSIEIDWRNFHDLSTVSVKQYDKIRKISTGHGDDYITGCLLDFAYFEKNYRLIAADLSKQKALDADSRAIQQIIFTGKIKAAADDTRVIIYYILEQSKETILEFAKGTAKVL